MAAGAGVCYDIPWQNNTDTFSFIPLFGHGFGFGLNPGDSGTMTITIKQSLVYIWASGTDSNGKPIPAPNPPKKAYFSLHGRAEEGALVGGTVDVATLLSVLSTFNGKSDDGLGDKPFIYPLLYFTTGPIWGWGINTNISKGSTSTGTHLVQKDGSSGTITFSFTVTAHGDGSIPAPPAFDPNPDYDPDAPPPTDQSMGGGVGYEIRPVDVQVVDPFGLVTAVIDKDNPLNTLYEPLIGMTVYGGSIPSTSDELRLDASDIPAVPGTTYQWSVDGDAAGAITSTPPSTAIWETGPLHAVPGTLKCLCDVERPDGSEVIKEADFRVGIRTDDCIAVGWIDQSGVPLNPAGVGTQILLELPPAKPFGNFSYVAGQARIAGLAADDDHYDYDVDNPYSIINNTDRNYILDWMFYYSNNPSPDVVLHGLHTFDFTDPTNANTTDDFTNHNGVIQYSKLLEYAGDAEYKLLNHFQVKYLVQNGKFDGTPVAIRSEAFIGATVDPFVLSPAELFSTQIGPANGRTSVSTDNTHIFHMNDGSPEAPAIRAFNTLMALDVSSPQFWENIGSKITFTCGNTTPDDLIRQNYPTYWVYQNGIHTVTWPEYASPKDEFCADPYPFGTATTFGLVSLQGGRNGDAASPADSTARIPAYVIP